jgi:bifunctional non-homologous end joining protein LigD
MAFKDGDTVRLRSRNNKDLNPSYPELVAAVRKLRVRSVVLDGEIVALVRGRTSFERVARRFGVKTAAGVKASGVKVSYAVFDMPQLNGRSLDRVSLDERKALLKRTVRFRSPLLYSGHVIGDGEAYLRQACRKGWEGIIAKRRASPYRHMRSSDWLKFKCIGSAELVIGGWTEPRGTRVAFGAVLVGYYERGKLRYAGKVGAGFDTKELTSILKELKKLEIRKNPFADDVREGAGRWTGAREATQIHFARPKLVGQFAFTEWTSDNSLRHPRFLGMRRDKKAQSVAREET